MRRDQWWRLVPREQFAAGVFLVLLALALSLGRYVAAGGDRPPKATLIEAPKDLVYPLDRFRAEELDRRERRTSR